MLRLIQKRLHYILAEKGGFKCTAAAFLRLHAQRRAGSPGLATGSQFYRKAAGCINCTVVAKINQWKHAAGPEISSFLLWAPSVLQACSLETHDAIIKQLKAFTCSLDLTQGKIWLLRLLGRRERCISEDTGKSARYWLLCQAIMVNQPCNAFA